MKAGIGQKRKMAAVFAALLVLFGMIAWLRASGYGGWDAAVAQAAARTQGEVWTRIWRFMNGMGTTAVIGGITLLSAFVWAARRSWKIALSFVGVALLAYLAQSALKAAFGWERPGAAWGIEHDGFGFPSGNATIAAALYGFWLLLGLFEIRGRAAKLTVCALASLLIVATGWSRIYFSVHYLSDVAAGFCAGGICALLVAFICSWRVRI